MSMQTKPIECDECGRNLRAADEGYVCPFCDDVEIYSEDSPSEDGSSTLSDSESVDGVDDDNHQTPSETRQDESRDDVSIYTEDGGE